MDAPLIITSGEPAGIGPDIILKYLLSNEPKPALVLGDPAVLAARARKLGLFCTIHETDAQTFFNASSVAFRPNMIYVSPVSTIAPVVPGQLNPLNAPYVLRMLDEAIEACTLGYVRAMVTAPVHKGVINQAGIPFSGHTEYLQEKTAAPHVVMLLANGDLRVALVTVHIPLKNVPRAVTQEAIIRVVKVVEAGLRRDFGIAAPRIAVCGLNPHAGEGGYLGVEEMLVIQPALNQLSQEGLTVSGPWPADTIFVPHHAKQYDVIVAMYHDQGLAAFKQASFGEGVNVTLGLPILRVSVDHGTALSLAGTGEADASSLGSACALASVLIKNRFERASS